jgi:anaerobic magnesium-protoporphyrin IX monomethyl ester cyclase
MPLAVMNLAAVLEGRWPWRIVDGNVEPDPVETALAALRAAPHALVGVSVMPGPQMISAIEISSAIRAAFPAVPIAWGGYFPTIYPDAAINAPYVDYLVRGQGELTLVDLLSRLPDAGPPRPLESAHEPTAIGDVPGLTWKRGGHAVHNGDRPGAPPGALPMLPYGHMPDIGSYLRPSYLGARTAVYQAALGCRYRCDFCGVVSMWNGKTLLEGPDRLLAALGMLRDRWGADCIQFYDNNFFDREETSLPLLDVLGTLQMPYWCFARTDTMARFSASTWEKVRKSRLRMAFFGAEAADDEILKKMKKGARVEHTLEVAARCREYGVVPELSFILGGPEDPEDQIEKTFAFIRRIKGINPDSDIVLQFYSPTPQVDRKALRSQPTAAHLPVMQSYGPSGPAMPTSPEEWAQPVWQNWVCQKDAPWLTARIRRRVKDVARVLQCRFPTIQDYRTSALGKSVLRNLARWRYATGWYGHSWELALARRFIHLRDPKTQSL